MGFASYFLIVWDYMRWARENGVGVGPGRGSAAGSLVAYALRIVDLDPLAHGLLFERFLNPGRKSMPDIDTDFAVAGRDRVVQYVTEKYGTDAVARIGTFGKLLARAVVRDAGRVLGHTYGQVDRIAKLVPERPIGIKLDDAMKPGTELAAGLRRRPDHQARSSTPPGRSRAWCATRASTPPASSSPPATSPTTCRCAWTTRATSSPRCPTTTSRPSAC